MRHAYEFDTDGQVEEIAEFKYLGHVDLSMGIEYPTGGTGTFVVETCIDARWTAQALFPVGGGASVTSIAAAGVWVAHLVGIARVRIKQSAAGTAKLWVAINATG